MNSRRQNRIIINIVAVVLIVAIAIVAALIILTRMDGGDARAQQDGGAGGQVQEKGSTEKWQEGNIIYQGKVYRYNSGIKTYLFLGIDNEGVMGSVEEGNYGGQSDAMFLLVTNSKAKTISIIAINRNAMVEVDTYDADGEYCYTNKEQICLQYSYGDGAQSSCQMTANTVSRLFHDIPISGYLSLNMDGIALLNDAVGGVTVEVMDDIENPGLGVSLKAGETVTLNGNEAYAYIRSRDMDTFASANRRLERQQQYLIQLLGKLLGAGNGDVSVLSVHDAVKDYLVSNIDMLKLAEDASEYEFDASDMYNIPGETVMGEEYEEFYIDEDAFYQMTIDFFYEEVE